jgi:hypothetical protein
MRRCEPAEDGRESTQVSRNSTCRVPEVGEDMAGRLREKTGGRGSMAVIQRAGATVEGVSCHCGWRFWRVEPK